MSSKRKRREARRRARQHDEPRAEDTRQGEAGVGSPAEDAAPAPQRPAEPVRQRPSRKRSRRARGPLGALSRMRLSPWLLMGPVLVVGVILIVVAIMTAGSSGTTGGSRATPTPDPRVAGLTPDVTLDVQAGDNFFQPTELTASAGEVIELRIDNVGAVVHNLRVAGLDNEYETNDDFGGQPLIIRAGEEGTVVVMIDEPGVYNFRCDLHPIEQRGTLVLA